MKPKKNRRSDILKLIGIVSMVIDHVGLFLFPGVAGLRIIGRLALPIFASGIADGFRYTSNLKAYLGRLLLVGVIVQVPMMLFSPYRMLNIMFTFIWGLMFLYFFKKKNYLLATLVLLSTFFVEIDYGYYGILLIFIFHHFGKKWLILLYSAIITIIFASHTSDIQLFLVLGVATALYFPAKAIPVRLPRYFFYWFYPVHLIIILLIKLAIEGTWEI